MAMELVDSSGRHINYLRLSITDLCNLRCRYCMPAQGVPKLCHDDVLRYEDLLRIAREAVALGIQKIRVTGGEPLVRKGVVDFVQQLAAIPGLRETVITTNGIRLRELAPSLRRAGVARLNVSLDSLKPETFATITRGGDLRQVLDGIAAAEDAGFPSPKINVVVMRGVNDDEVADFAALTLHKPCTVRFIEYMPTNKEPGWKSLCVTGADVLARIAKRYPLTPIEGSALAGPARNFAIPGALGAIGIITPISRHFCEGCNRIRVTASGIAKGCLFAKDGIDLKPHLLFADNLALREALRRLVMAKPLQHALVTDPAQHQAFAMSQIGG